MKTTKCPKKAAIALFPSVDDGKFQIHQLIFLPFTFGSVKTDLRKKVLTPKKAFSSSVRAISISRKGYSRKAASKDRPAG